MPCEIRHLNRQLLNIHFLGIGGAGGGVFFPELPVLNNILSVKVISSFYSEAGLL